jgi:hypothetical protein
MDQFPAYRSDIAGNGRSGRRACRVTLAASRNPIQDSHPADRDIRSGSPFSAYSDEANQLLRPIGEIHAGEPEKDGSTIG